MSVQSPKERHFPFNLAVLVIVHSYSAWCELISSGTHTHMQKKKEKKKKHMATELKAKEISVSEGF